MTASHYAFFWLLIYKDAVQSLLSNHEARVSASELKSNYTSTRQKSHHSAFLAAKSGKVSLSNDDGDYLAYLRQSIEKRIQSEHHHLPVNPIHKTAYVDNIQCFTSFEPINDIMGSLYSLIIPSAFQTQIVSSTSAMHLPHGERFYNSTLYSESLASSNLLTRHQHRAKAIANRKIPFHVDIYENVTRPDIIEMARSRGYLDYKYMLYGNNESIPLSLKASVRKQGVGFICQPPSDWG